MRDAERLVLVVVAKLVCRLRCLSRCREPSYPHPYFMVALNYCDDGQESPRLAWYTVSIGTSVSSVCGRNTTDVVVIRLGSHTKPRVE